MEPMDHSAVKMRTHMKDLLRSSVNSGLSSRRRLAGHFNILSDRC